MERNETQQSSEQPTDRGREIHIVMTSGSIRWLAVCAVVLAMTVAVIWFGDAATVTSTMAQTRQEPPPTGLVGPARRPIADSFSAHH